MILWRAHLLCLAWLAAAPASACGAVTESAVVASADARDIVLANQRRLRLGGVALGPGAEPALQALAGRSVGVAFLRPSPDRWGRRIVDLVDPEGQSVAVSLLLQGVARVNPEPETRACDAERFEAEQAARAAGEGDWARPDAVLASTDVAALAKADGRFTLVTGVVRRVGLARAKVYLDFAGRGGFSVIVARKAESRFQKAGIDLKALVGRKVLVRGVVDNRYGPRIEIADPSLIEPLESGKETGRGG